MESLSRSEGRLPVAVLGATGLVGQCFLALLEGHPWFRVEAVMASERSAGRPYGEVARWVQDSPLPPTFARLPVEPCRPERAWPLVFSALDADVAGPVEEAFAASGALVVTNAKSHRMDPDVPLVVPEINADHLGLVEERAPEPGRGAILANPNCTTIGLALALAPLDRAFGVDRVHVVSLQALSGGGLAGLENPALRENVVPHIAGEEEKVEVELAKLLARRDGARLAPPDLCVAAQCNRVGVTDGHTLCVSVGLRRTAAREDLLAAWRDFRGEPQTRELPTAPCEPVHLVDEEDGPQPARDRDRERGMAVAVGRVRPCPILDWRFVTVSHNAVRGAAGGAVLLAELFLARARERG